MGKIEQTIAGMSEKLDTLSKAVDQIIEKLDTKYVTVESFAPIKNIVYGMISALVMGVFVLLVSHVIPGFNF